MRVRIVKDSYWFRVGEVVDIDYFVAKQLIQMGNAEEVKEKEQVPKTEKKVEESAERRVKK